MSKRLAYFLGFLFICVLLLISVYLQLYEGLQPCPLCTLQRLTFGLIGCVFLLGVITASSLWGRLISNTLLLLSSALGILLAGRQVWLQNFPSDDGNECGVSLQYMMDVLPFNQLMQKVLAGTAECTKRGWEFLHLNMAEWALVWFVAFFFLAVYFFLKEIKH